MTEWKKSYRVFRSILFTAIMVIAVLYIGLYVFISMPSVQNAIRNRAEKELTAFFKADVKIGSLEIFPFNEARLNNVIIYTPKGEKCIFIEKLGAGIQLWTFIYDKKIEITYAEIIGLDGRIWQQKKDGPLNIAFLIDAFKPKDKKKPPTKIDLKLRNILIRKSAISFSRRWIPERENQDRIDFNHLAINDLKADVTIPQIKNDDFVIDLRRLAFREKSGLNIERLSFKTHVTPKSISINNFVLKLPNSEIRPSDISLNFNSFKDIKEALSEGSHNIEMIGNRISPSDFAAFLPWLRDIPGYFDLDVSLDGNINDLAVNRINLENASECMSLMLSANLKDISDPQKGAVHLEQLSLQTQASFINAILAAISPSGGPLRSRLANIDKFDISVSGDLSLPDRSGNLELLANTGYGNADVISELSWNDKDNFNVDAQIEVTDLAINRIIEKSPIGMTSMMGDIELSMRGKMLEGTADMDIEYLEFNGKRIENMTVSVSKNRNEIHGEVDVDNNLVSMTANSDVTLAGSDSKWYVYSDIRHMVPSAFVSLPKYKGYTLSGVAEANLEGNGIDNITGTASIESLSMASSNDPGIHMRRISLSSENTDGQKLYSIDSDFLRGKLWGGFEFRNLIATVKGAVNRALPSLTPKLANNASEDSIAEYAEFNLRLLPNERLANFLDLPFRPYDNVDIDGTIDVLHGTSRVKVNAPYVVQGKSKLLRNIKVAASFDRDKGIAADILGTLPVKNDAAVSELTLSAFEDNVFADVGWQLEKNKNGSGNVNLSAGLSRNPLSKVPDVNVTLMPSVIKINGADWKIDESNVSYASNVLNIEGLKVWHGDQFVDIEGRASASETDEMKVSLADVDLSYIFNTLNINYVTFGGLATGEFSATRLFSNFPVIRTRNLFIKDMSYNGEVLGDGTLQSHWDNDQKMVAINADIREADGKGALINGGVYITRDSLSFDMDADKVNIGFLKPFMSGFTSDVSGRASGKVKLFGTFKNIDLTGRVLADPINIKVDQTNVYYHGTDSVIMESGKISIPSFTLHDKFGNTGRFSGYLKHDYFHRPNFEFRITDARNLLGFDTNPKINPDWYGTVFVNGSGVLQGRPGLVSLQMDVSTTGNSTFTFVLSETQTAADYTFLTFSDRRKEELLEVDATVDIEEKFRKKVEEPVLEKPTLFTMNIRGDITKNTKVSIVMDPVAGDKIAALGSGPMQITYDTDTDEMKVYGKYTLDEGNYNFSLQDLILRDFKINPGSSISFNGDPLQGILDITAAYRVNTNLSDLDKSFSTDRDLNRTNVPVDALLKVNGDMKSPEISFDIALPTLTSDVERKVKSIINTDDMLNRQIIYLLALNRFYTPEYMNTTSNGGELASVASSTISSQLSNMMGQLTDKVTFAPSFRSDKGDFSDMEVDLALSSRLLNNRLLINGNFGYRDRTTSNTTFVGDFDIEYLLSKSGDLRLKAYNHFNDQNYYLKSSLTTQGIGVIYRHDFNNPFSFLKRRTKKTVKPEAAKESKSDTLKSKEPVPVRKPDDGLLTIGEKKKRENTDENTINKVIK